MNKYLSLLGLMLLAHVALTAAPIQRGALNGAAVADARLKLISAAASFLGTPYRYSGLDKNGMDCSGLVYASFKEALDYSVPRSSEDIYEWSEKISTNELQPGDLVFFVTTGNKVSHVGIYTGDSLAALSLGRRSGIQL